MIFYSHTIIKVKYLRNLFTVSLSSPILFDWNREYLLPLLHFIVIMKIFILFSWHSLCFLLCWHSLTQRKIHCLEKMFCFCGGKLHVQLNAYLKGFSSLSYVLLKVSIHIVFYFFWLDFFFPLPPVNFVYLFKLLAWRKSPTQILSDHVTQENCWNFLSFLLLALIPAVPDRRLIRTRFHALITFVEKNTEGWTMRALISTEQMYLKLCMLE